MMESKTEKDHEHRQPEQAKPESRLGEGSSDGAKDGKSVDLSKESMPSGYRPGEGKDEAKQEGNSDRSSDTPKEEKPTDLSKESMPTGHREGEVRNEGRQTDASDGEKKPVDLSNESMPGGHREEGQREVRIGDAPQEPKRPDEY